MTLLRYSVLVPVYYEFVEFMLLIYYHGRQLHVQFQSRKCEIGNSRFHYYYYCCGVE